MPWQVIVMLVLSIPIILLPVAFVWYLNIGGLRQAMQESRQKQLVEKKGVKVKARLGK